LCTSFSSYRDKKVVGVFVRFRAPLQLRCTSSAERPLEYVNEPVRTRGTQDGPAQPAVLSAQR
jgi:hypothetical protein